MLWFRVGGSGDQRPVGETNILTENEDGRHGGATECTVNGCHCNLAET